MAHLRTDTSMNSHFARVPTISKSRNAFSVAERHLTTMQFDILYPAFHKFIYPGDTISISHGLLARLQTQIGVLYDDLYVDAHAWFVPMRLIQTNWARYQFNAQPGGPSQDNSALTAPSINASTLPSNQFQPKSLYDYFGYPTLVTVPGTEYINNYLGRAYNLIWNENYRDQNLQNPVTVDLSDGSDNPLNYVLLKRGKRHDIFTSALPFQQKGPAASIPIGNTVPVISNNLAVKFSAMDNSFTSLDLNGRDSGSGSIFTLGGTSSAANRSLKFGNESGLVANLAAATTLTVNAWRNSVAVQHLLEADARGGTRDVESIQHRWGVTVPDFRLQRPEYLGGQTFSFDGHIVPQTSATGVGDTPQANLTQFSQAMSHMSLNHSFVEHGVLMILISARSNLTYQQGLQKELSYRTRYDWYQPEFANLGEVAVKNKEIFFQGTSVDNDPFGYNEYAYELRFGFNRVSAEMRSNYAQSLDTKHMADDYASLPTLSSAWIQSNTPISRNIAVSASVADPIEINMLAKGTIARTLPMYSVPGLWRL